ncbi:MAG TPA: TonB family protein [Candidatus Cybelea sp.]|nr:TonB family protein [Candidatus Cybelea sp.]
MTIIALAILIAQATPSPSATLCMTEAAGVEKGAVVQIDEVPTNQGAFYATVSVLVGPDGKVEKATIVKPSGNFQFDMASVTAAKHSTYTPKKVDCMPVEGTVLFNTSFVPPG